MSERTYTDPDGMPEDERMTPAEMKVVREFLGLSGQALADHLDVSARTVRHWEEGRYPIPDGVRLSIEKLEETTADLATRVVAAIMDVPEPTVVTYRHDQTYHAAHPEVWLPASWHRALTARVAQEVVGLSIVFAEDVDDATTRQRPVW